MQAYNLCKRVDRALTHHPPDHWIGYVVAISGALMQMMSYGIDNSFSIFTNDMENDASLGYPSATTVSFGNSVSLGLSPIFGVLAGFLVDRVPPRLMMFASTVTLFAALWLSSTFATSSAQVTAAYSLLASLSSALMLSPGAAATGSWFQRQIGLGQGINFCGGGIGSAVVPAVVGSLVKPYGWRHTFRVMSSFCAIGLLGTLLSCRRHPIDEEDDVYAEDLQQFNASGGDGCDTVREPIGSEFISNASPDHHAPLRHHVTRGEEEAGAEGLKEIQWGSAHAATPRDADTTGSPTTQLIREMRSSVDGDGLSRDGKANSATGASVSRTVLDDGDAAAGVAAAADVGDLSPNRSRALAEILEDLHTRRLTSWEIVRVLFSVRFLTHLFMFAIYGWAFYGLIYITVPYVSSMGAANTVYAHVPSISTAKASTTFTFWGVCQIIGSILVGGLGSLTSNALAYTLCAGVGGVACALLAFCRSYAAFVVCLGVVGFCTAGVFAMMPALIAKDFHGPNLGFLMGCVFVAGCLGGFSAPPIQAQLQTRHNGNYSHGCAFISCCLAIPGIICYVMLWSEKQTRLGRLLGRAVKKVALI